MFSDSIRFGIGEFHEILGKFKLRILHQTWIHLSIGHTGIRPEIKVKRIRINHEKVRRTGNEIKIN